MEALRARRDRLATQVAELDGARRDAEARRARSEASAAMGEERMARADRELASLAERERILRAERDALAVELARAIEAETRARSALDELLAADTADRGRLAAAETDASTARERLRATDERLRSADVGELEARLGLDAIRESVLVELAGIGEPGVRRLAEAAGEGRDLAAGIAAEADGLAASGSAAAEPARRRGRSRAPMRPPRATRPRMSLSSSACSRRSDLPGPPHRRRPTRPRPGGWPPCAGAITTSAPPIRSQWRSMRPCARLETLDVQAADLRAAISRTRALIEELNELIARQFRTTFEALEAAFDRRFQQLFGGGFAKLSLTDPTDLSATGVEIVARPPGKKAQNLSMLSGGERALTAVALLFAMLEVRPVPFCVLDEVDAALDEANVGRFAEALRELAERTQCIVITHNRGTIEAADALYGVTVGDDSVSRVISLRLEEAQAIADRARRSDRLAAG